MDTKKSIEFVNSLRRPTFRYHSGITDCDDAKDIRRYNGNIDEVIYKLDRGAKSEKMLEALKERYGCHYYKHPIDSHLSQMSPIGELMVKLEAEFFGSSPTTVVVDVEKINDIMTKMRDLGIAKNDIINMLIELRDKEEKV